MKKNSIKKILILLIIFFIIYISINKLSNFITSEISNEDIIFTLYRNSVLGYGNSYLFTMLIIYINIVDIDKYLNTYSVVRYKSKAAINFHMFRDIINNNCIFFILLNILFFINMILMFGISYINSRFIIYVLLSSVIQVLGLTIVMLCIVFIYLIINNIICSSIIVFTTLMLQEAFLRVIKSNAKSFLDIIYFKCSFETYLNNIVIQISFLISFMFASILLYILIDTKLKKKDILNGKK